MHQTRLTLSSKIATLILSKPLASMAAILFFLAASGLVVTLVRDRPLMEAYGWAYGLMCAGMLYALRNKRNTMISRISAGLIQSMLLYTALERLVLAAVLLAMGLWFLDLPAIAVVLAFICAQVLTAFMSATQLSWSASLDSKDGEK